MEDTGETDSAAILTKSCQSMSKHAAHSSNLAALSLHVTRMLRQLVRDIRKESSSGKRSVDLASSTADFSKRISRVGKARATAGALQLLRLLCHPVVQNCRSMSTGGHCTDSGLEEALLYRTRGDIPCDQPAGRPLVYSILDLITIVGGEGSEALATPEIYDATVISFQLLLVLCGTQLYQPFLSSFQTTPDGGYDNYVLDELLKDEPSWVGDTVAGKNYGLFYASSQSSLSYSSHRDANSSHKRRRQHLWTPFSVLFACMELLIRRPTAPEGSIAHYYFTIAQAVVATRGSESLAPDGMYESYMIVHAAAPNTGDTGSTSETSLKSAGSASGLQRQHVRQNVILDATKGVLVLGSSIIMLPFRLMSLVFGVITSGKKHHGSEDAQLFARKIKLWSSSRTRDVLWLSESMLADLAGCLVLLLVNNRRNGTNAFRSQLKQLADNRWENETDQMQELPDLPSIQSFEGEDDSLSIDEIQGDETKQLLAADSLGGEQRLSINFERLFDTFGRILHTEVGALLLYTLYQTSPAFAESLVVRSDLDALVLPLLRTLYFSSSTKTYVATDFTSHKTKGDSSTRLDIRSCPFRSQSQLYVIVILLLLFSQDSSFGRDAFRRINVHHIVWYKERNLRNINLGSVIILTLLRSLMFNLQRLQDAFLLSNCCAVLQNISPPIVDLHEYAAMRLASVTVSVTKKHSMLHSSSTGESTKEHKSLSSLEDAYMSTPLSMYEEVARTLLEAIHHCLSPKTIDRNLHLVYALIYHQADFNRILNEKKLYPAKLRERIQSVVEEAAAIIQGEGARTATKALKVLETQIERLQKVSETKRQKEHDDIAFTYEEEADPEIFFVPYVWEIIVCVVTPSAIEWKKDDIKAFGLLDPVGETLATGGDVQVQNTNVKFSKDADELV